VVERLAHNHGSAYGDVLQLARETPSYAMTIGASGTLAAEVIHAIRNEMAQTLADSLFRRTDLGTAGHPGDDALAACAALMAEELRWSAGRTELELAEVRGRYPGSHGPGRISV
jgi:glycerol-3-phosphate dehydrogenase